MMFGKIYVFVDWCWERKQLELWSREASRARVGIWDRPRIRKAACGMEWTPKLMNFQTRFKRPLWPLSAFHPETFSKIQQFCHPQASLNTNHHFFFFLWKLRKGPYCISIRAFQLFLVDKCVRKDLLVGTFARILSLINSILKQQTMTLAFWTLRVTWWQMWHKYDIKITSHVRTVCLIIIIREVDLFFMVFICLF